MRQLSKEKLRLIDDLFEFGGDEQAVIKKHNISPQTLKRWLRQDSFKNELNFRRDRARRQSSILLAKYVPLAAAKLVQLCDSEKEETARKACLDILSLGAGSADDSSISADTADSSPAPAAISPQTASKLLETLADCAK